MATIPRSVIDAFTRQLEQVTEVNRQALDEALARVDWSADVATVREQVCAAMQVWCGGATDQAAMLASVFYDGVREVAIGSPLGALAQSRRDPRRTDGAVRAFMQDIVDGKGSESVRLKCLDRLDYEVKRAAAECVDYNAGHDRAKPRYARVPASGEVCGFCLMLASRGAVYRSEASAGGMDHWHANCKCRVVPVWDTHHEVTDKGGIVRRGGTRVEGYDPETLYAGYDSCVHALGGQAQLRRDWKALPEDERAGWMARHPGRFGSDEPTAMNAYVARRIAAEIESRDPNWMQTGEAPEIDYERCPRSAFGGLRKTSERFNPEDYDESNVVNTRAIEWRDMFAHDALAHNGFRVSARESKALDAQGVVIDGVTTPDIEIDGTIWEIKSVRDGGKERKPENELSFIEQSIRDARNNFRNPYDPEKMSGMGDMRDKTRVVINTRYRTVNASQEDIEKEFAYRARRYGVDVIWIDSRGVIRRFGKQ